MRVVHLIQHSMAVARLRPLCRVIMMGFVLVLLQACQLLSLNPGFTPDTALEQRMLDNSNATPMPAVDLLAVDGDLAAYMSAHVDTELRGWDLVIRLQELLFAPEFLNIQYDDSANFSASEAFARRRANCLTLVNLYIAMARYNGLQVEYQTAQVRPQWDRRGELMVMSEHINALGSLGGSDQYIVDFLPNVPLQHQTAEVITDQQALALYFNNLAVDHLVNERIDDALTWFRYALEADPELAIAWNNMGSAWNAAGDDERAEYSYMKAAWLDKNYPTAVNNLARFYAIRGNETEAARYRRAVQHYNNRNPYFHYARGNIAFNDEDYESAQAHYQRAIQRNRLEPDFYLALGLTYRELGQDEEFQEARDLAVALRELGDQTYRTSQSRVRRVDNRTILRASSAGFSVRFDN
ncbi:tetratricopeptide repeat protein [Pseudohongiella acticola]|jgi:Flp pilus assembly protein TadD|uniref:tetratricopeptide repeat protein n=1 Tax=Pseudohongiella acticola TaxID=1524254 RepID=UPI0030EC9209